jgi:hypothetical protein
VTIEECIAKAEKSVKTVTTYRLPPETPIVDGFYDADRIHPIRVEVTEYDDNEIRVEITGYKVKKNGEHKGASWHGVSSEVQKQFEEALGFRRVTRLGFRTLTDSSQ